MLTLEIVSSLLLQYASAQEGTITVEKEEEKTEISAYTISEGDTLWAISQKMLGDSQYWPELWSINEYITNPHWIYPGNVIVFTPGTTIDPPGIDLLSGEPEDYTVQTTQYVATESLCGPDIRFDFKQPTGTFVVPGFIAQEENLTILGTVDHSPQNQEYVVEHDKVYMKLSDPELYRCGDVVTVIRKIKKNVRHPHAFFHKYGSMYRIVGEVRILHQYGNYVVGEIRGSYSEMKRSDLVVRSMPTAVQLEVDIPNGDLQGVIIDRLAQEHSFSTERDTVFIDKGHMDGVMVGDTFYLITQKDPYVDDRKENYALPPTIIGRVVVVQVNEDNSVAVLTDAENIIGVESDKTPVSVTQSPF